VHADVYELEKELVGYLNIEIMKWGKKEFNSKDCRFIFKRECIADVGLFLQKKRYVMNILDDEGVKVNKMKYTGVEIVRTSLPSSLKPHMKNVIETMLKTQSYSETNKAMGVVYDVFKKLKVSELATVVGVSNYDKYARQCSGTRTVKGMPVHHKASYFYNMLIKEHKLNKHEPINSGDKVRYFYVKKPNRYRVDAIAFKYEWPEEFDEFFKPDYDYIFEKIVYKPFHRYYNAVNWRCYMPNQAVQCDLFEMLGE
jgi:DNA polymerase elongation subunit (family B)